MKLPITMGITKELLEEIAGFKIDKILDVKLVSNGTTISIELIAEMKNGEMTDESFN